MTADPTDLLPVRVSSDSRNSSRRIDGLIAIHHHEDDDDRIMLLSRFVPVVLMNDITEQERAEQAARERDERLRVLFEALRQ